MKLRQKTLLIVSMTLVGLIGVIYITSSAILMGSIRKAEENEAQQTVKGVEGLLVQTQESFRDRFADWSAWDDTYTFIQKNNQEFIHSNLVPQQLANLKVNLIVFVNTSGQIVYGTGFDLENQQYKPVPKELRDRLSPNEPLLQHSDLTYKQAGIILLPEGPMLITSQPILTSQGYGPILGSLLVGRYLDQKAVKRLERIARLPITIYPVDDAKMPSDFQAMRRTLLRHTALPKRSEKKPIFVVQPLSEKLMGGYTLLNDIYGNPALILRVDIPRNTYQQGQQSLLYLVVSLLTGGAVFASVAMLLLEKSILSRLANLTGGVSRIRDSGDLSLRLSVSGKDEIYDLASETNTMLEALETAQRNLKNTLSQLGQANAEITALNERLEAENIRIYEHNQQMSRYIQQVEKVTAAAAAVEQDTFESESLNEVAARSDELGQLARVFQQMVKTVKAREQELAQAKDQLEAVLNAVPGSIFWIDSQGVYLGVNRYLAQNWNLSQDAFIGREVGFLKGNSHLAEFMRKFLASSKTSASSVIEVEVKEQVRYYLVAAQKYQQGTATVSVAIDITDRKQAEEALRIAEENYRTIFENALEGIFQSTPEGKYISVNPAMARIYGYGSPEEMIATVTEISHQIYVDPTCRDEFQRLMHRNGKVTNFEYQAYRKDGNIIWVEEDARAVCDRNGNLLYYEGLIQDISARKRQEEDLRRRLQELRIQIDQQQHLPEVTQITQDDSQAQTDVTNSPLAARN